MSDICKISKLNKISQPIFFGFVWEIIIINTCLVSNSWWFSPDDNWENEGACSLPKLLLSWAIAVSAFYIFQEILSQEIWKKKKKKCKPDDDED